MKIRLQDIQTDKAGQYVILAGEKKYVTAKKTLPVQEDSNVGLPEQGVNTAVRAAERINGASDDAVQAGAGTAYRAAKIAEPNELLGKSREYAQYKPKMPTQGYGYKAKEDPARSAENLARNVANRVGNNAATVVPKNNFLRKACFHFLFGDS